MSKVEDDMMKPELLLILLMSMKCLGLSAENGTTSLQSETKIPTTDKAPKKHNEASSPRTMNVSDVLDKLVTALEHENSAKAHEELKNVVLLMVEDAEDTNAWAKLMANHSFSVEGQLKSYIAQDVSNGSSLAAESHDCPCERVLKGGLSKLSSWARVHRGMNTASVSGGNFHLTDLENPLASNGSSEVFGFKLHLGEEHSSAPASHRVKRDIDNGLWDFMDMFTRIRLTLFRNFLESLRNGAKSNKQNAFKSSVLPRTDDFASLVSSSLMDLKSVANEKGFLLIAVVPSRDISSVLEIVDHQTLRNETLVVVTGSCSHKNNLMPFFASGPRATAVRGCEALTELPNAIKSILEDCCKGHRELALPPGALTPKKRVVRSEDDEPSVEDERPIGEYADGASSSDSTSDMPDINPDIMGPDDEVVQGRAEPDEASSSEALSHKEKSLIMIFSVVIIATFKL